MSAASMPDFHQFAERMAPLRLGQSASELHGAITGLLCAGGKPGTQGWLGALQLEAADRDAARRFEGELDELARTTASGLEPSEASLELLLPPLADGLEARALGLVDWCRGFLGGFGLAGLDAAHLPEGMTGVLGDFSDIAATEPELGDKDEDRAALEELAAHVRFGALLLRAQLTAPEGATRQ